MGERIRLSRAKGWRLPANAVNVARPGKWGNPFVVGTHGTREQCVAMFIQLVRGFIDLGGPVDVDAQHTYYRRIRRSLDELKGRDLACWCALDGKPCHGDVLLHLANETPLPAWAKQSLDIGRVRLGMSVSDLERLKRSGVKKARAA
jgi:hypothetical protein